jgi:hypothetical protein
MTGAHRTWLDPDGKDDQRPGKAPIETPRRAMGDLLGNAVRFGPVEDVLAAGEGIETMLSLRTVLPSMPMAAALSTNHLAALLWPANLRRLYVAVDDDRAGLAAAKALTARALDAGIEAIAWSSRLEDFNEDLRIFGPDALREALHGQLLPEDASRFRTSPWPRTLRKIALVTAIRGNADTGDWATGFAGTEFVRFAGRLLYVLHDLNTLQLIA